ncbi:MAG: hypothetical protein LBE83_10420, partial [Propionibacteriaceae bacterium]|nr:hypothetical protein [Propionibacteriaceae bacterium]
MSRVLNEQRGVIVQPMSPQEFRAIFCSRQPKIQSAWLADRHLAGEMWVSPSLEAVAYDPAEFDFSARLTDAPMSYQLYLQGLVPLQYLMVAYADSEDERYW